MKYFNIIIVTAILFLSHVTYGQDLSIKVYGACGMCQERIESNALNVIGVNTASWDQETMMLAISYASGLFQENELHQKMISIEI